MLVTVIADASWCPRTRAGGWAAWVRAEGTKIARAGAFKGRAVSSNQAEEWALRNGMYIAAQVPGVTRLLAQSDCLNMLQRMPEIVGGLPVEYRHVKGHTKNPAARSWVNRWCDAEAKKHMRSQRKTLVR